MVEMAIIGRIMGQNMSRDDDGHSTKHELEREVIRLVTSGFLGGDHTKPYNLRNYPIEGRRQRVP